MKDIFSKILTVMGVAIVLIIIFVRAGEKTNVSGAQQAATILDSGFKGLNSTLRTLTGSDVL